jgi:hypothetical protein
VVVTKALTRPFRKVRFPLWPTLNVDALAQVVETAEAEYTEGAREWKRNTWTPILMELE